MYLTQAVPLRGFGPPRRHGWWWLALAGAGQPLAMEAYNLAAWLEPDPTWVRMVTVGAPALVSGLIYAGIVRNEDYDDQWLLAAIPVVAACIVAWAAWGVAPNGVYRSTFLALQLTMVFLWLRTMLVKTAWLLEYWAKWTGLAFAVIGVHLCVLAQFAPFPAPLAGVLQPYDPLLEPVSAETRAGLAATVWLMPLGSALAIVLLTAADRWRRARRRRFSGPLPIPTTPNRAGASRTGSGSPRRTRPRAGPAS